MTGTSCDHFAVYQINIEQSPETKKTGKERFFAQILKIFGKKEVNDLNVNSKRLVSKLMFVISSFFIGGFQEEIRIQLASF